MIKKEGSVMGYLFSSSSSGKPPTDTTTASSSSPTDNNTSAVTTTTTTNMTNSTPSIQISESPQSPTPRESGGNVSSAKQAGGISTPEEKKKPIIKDRQSQRVMDIQLPEHIKLPPTSLPPLYFNIVLLNKGEAVEKTIQKKTGLKKGGIFSKAMSAAANSVISDKAIIDKLSEQLKTNLENTVREMGIVATVSKAFQQGE